MKAVPYLNFDGRCQDAIDFYKGAVGAKVNRLMRFKDMPPQPQSPDCPPPSAEHMKQMAEKVMHADLTVGDSKVLVSDGRCEGKEQFQGISLTLMVANEAEADRAFSALSKGGKVTMPLGKTFFSPRFGMCQDKFGLGWMVIVETPM